MLESLFEVRKLGFCSKERYYISLSGMFAISLKRYCWRNSQCLTHEARRNKREPQRIVSSWKVEAETKWVPLRQRQPFYTFNLLGFCEEFLHGYSQRIAVYIFLYSWCLCFWYKDQAVMKWTRKCSLLFNFSWRIGSILSSIALYVLLGKSSEPQVIFVGVFVWQWF